MYNKVDVETVNNFVLLIEVKKEDKRLKQEKGFYRMCEYGKCL